MQYVRFNYAEKDLSLKRCSARLERTVRISMAIRKIFTDDAECLYKVCRPVEHFNKRLYDLLDDMAETMYNAEGVGLAAPQVGILRRVVVMDCGDG